MHRRLPSSLPIQNNNKTNMVDEKGIRLLDEIHDDLLFWRFFKAGAKQLYFHEPMLFDVFLNLRDNFFC